MHKSDARVKLLCLLVWQLLIWRTDTVAVLSVLATVCVLYIACRVSLSRTVVAIRIIILLSLASVAVPALAMVYRSGWAPYLSDAAAGRIANGRYALRLLTTALTAHLFATTTPVARWVDAIEWLLLPFRRARAALGLIILVALNHITIIQQYHHRVMRGIRSRLRSRRRQFRYGVLLRYCLSLILVCARFATLSTVAISARPVRLQPLPAAVYRLRAP